MTREESNFVPPVEPLAGRVSFGEDFKRFFVRGAATLLPTLITLIVLSYIWGFLSGTVGGMIGQAVVDVIQGILNLASHAPPDIRGWYRQAGWGRDIVNVVSAIVLVYIVGVLVGNFIGHTAYRLTELGVVRLPLVRTIYPAARQITDYLITDKKKAGKFRASRVVAVEPHASGIWSIGLVTGTDLRPLSEKLGTQMVTVFIPSSPTAFSGYVVVVPRDKVVELPMSVEEAMRLLVSAGVVAPQWGTAPQVPVPQVAAHHAHPAVQEVAAPWSPKTPDRA